MKTWESVRIAVTGLVKKTYIQAVAIAKAVTVILNLKIIFDYYENNVAMTPNRSLKLVKEQDNKFDKDAIAVYAQDKKIGYVANNDHIRCKLTLSASEHSTKFKILLRDAIKKRKKLRVFDTLIRIKNYSLNGCGSSQTSVPLAMYLYTNAAQIAPKIGPIK